MTVEQYNTYAKQLSELIQLRTFPLAIKWYEKAADVPAEAIFPTRDMHKHMAMCQVFSYARMKGQTIAMTTKDHWCWNPLIGYGNVECVPGQPQFDEVVKFIGIPDKEQAAKFFEKFPRLPLGKYEAVVVAPLTTCTFEPDVIMIYSTPFKINYLTRCIKSILGGHFTSVFDGIDSCIYCTVPTFQTGEFRVTLPDPGEVERARARDDEVILTVPPAKFEALVKSVENMSKMMKADDKMLEIPLDFPRPPFYNRLFEIWGLEQGEDWDHSAGR